MGKAYADNLNAEEMKVNRDAGIESVIDSTSDVYPK